jgi:hypothetical protein
MQLFGSFYGKPGSKSLVALWCGHFIENMEIIVYNPFPARVLNQSSITIKETQEPNMPTMRGCYKNRNNSLILSFILDNLLNTVS